MKLLIVAATEFEILPTLKFLNEQAEKKNDTYLLNNHSIEILISGVGVPLTMYNLTKIYSKKTYSLAIQVGIGGTFDSAVKLGDVFEISEDKFADIGVEEANGNFKSVFDLGFLNPDSPPFTNQALINTKTKNFNFLPKLKGITVNKVSGSNSSIAKIRESYPTAQVESMEGAAFHLVNLLEDRNFMQLRAISNYVEPRNKENWKIELAIHNLNKSLKDFFKY